MSNWWKHWALLFFIVSLLIITGCNSSLDMPLSKEEASQTAALEKEETVSSGDVKEEKENLAKDATPTVKNDTRIERNKKVEDISKHEEESSTSSNQKSESSNPRSETKSEKKQQPDSTNNTETSKKKTDNDTSEKKETNQPNHKKEDNTASENNSSESEPNDTEPEATPANTIVFSIVISEETNEIPLPPTEMEIEEGDTVLQALINITKEKRIQMDYRGGQGATAYVEGIDNVYEFDRGQGSGWMYRVNGIFPDRGAGVVPLLPGDRVEWLYTTNLGVDLGANLQPFRR